MKLQLRRREGFTLIELLIVIVIIGILAVGFAPTLLNAPKKARDSVRKGQMAGIVQVIEAYALEKGSYPTAITGATIQPFYPGDIVPTFITTPTAQAITFTAIGTACYLLSFAVEDTSSGNVAAVPATCTAPTASSGAYYYMMVPIN